MRLLQRFNTLSSIHLKKWEHLDNIVYYPDCNDMSDLAYYLIEETGALGEVPTHLQNYIDYEAYGRDLEIEGNYLVTSRGVFELCE